MHPCAGHMATCDHCYSCDVLGICCCAGGTTSSTSSAFTSPVPTPGKLDDIQAAMRVDAAQESPLTRAFGADRIRRLLPALMNNEVGGLSVIEAAEKPPIEPLALPAGTEDVHRLMYRRFNRAS